MWFILSLLRLLMLSPMTFLWANWGNMGYYEIILMWKKSELKNPVHWILFIYQRFSGHLKRIMKKPRESCFLSFVLFTFAWVTFMKTMCLFVSGNESKLGEISLEWFFFLFLIGKVKFIKKSQSIGPRTEKGTKCTPIKWGITDQAVMVWKGSEELEQLRKWKEVNNLDIHMN